ncbi:MAG: flagellar protein FlgN [Firmicutes bacterium]|nr:flagellar protein FlgN [Bacillota bacterium]
MWKELISVLTKILDIYKYLLVLSKEKRLVIVNVKMKELEKIVRQEQLMIAIIGKLEQQRGAVLTSLILSENISTTNKELLDLVMFCDQSTGREITEIHNQFKETLAELETNNKMNNHLISQALSVVNHNLKLRKPDTEPATSASQEPEQVLNTKRFDCKA